MRSARTVVCYAISRNWLTSGGAVPPGQQYSNTQYAKHQNTENKKTWLNIGSSLLWRLGILVVFPADHCHQGGLSPSRGVWREKGNQPREVTLPDHGFSL